MSFSGFISGYGGLGLLGKRAVDQPSQVCVCNFAGVGQAPVWRNLSTRLLDWSINGPTRRRITDRYNAGTASIELDNGEAPAVDDGLGTAPFTRTNAASPFYGLLKAMREIKLGFGYAPLVFSALPVLHLRLGEEAGSTSAADESINGHVGTYVGAPTLEVDGIVGGNSAATFDGTTQYLTVPDHATLDVGDTFTLEAWVMRAANGTDHVIVDKGAAGGVAPLLRISAAGTLQLARGDLAAVLVSSTITITADGSWHHAVATKSGSTVKLYVDGVDVTGVVTNYTFTNTTSALAVGRRTGTAAGYFAGSIDEVAVYPAALTAAEVLAHYLEANPYLPDGWEFSGYVDGWPREYSHRNSDTITVAATDSSKRLSRFEMQSVWEMEVKADSPIAWWRLGEQSGTAAVDSSGNGRIGAYGGGATLNTRTGLVAGDADHAVELATAGQQVTIPATVAPTLSYPFTIEAMVEMPSGTTPAGNRIIWEQSMGPSGAYLSVFLGGTLEQPLTPGTLGWFNIQAGSPRIVRSAGPNLFDGRPHHIVVVVNSASSETFYVDGVAYAGTVAGAGPAATPLPGPMVLGAASDGRAATGVGTETYFGGILDEVAVYSSALSAARVAAHSAAAFAPWYGDLPGARAARVLGAVGISAAARQLDTGRSTMAAAVGIQGASAFEALLDAGDAEGLGAVYVDGDGAVVLVSRDTVWTATSARVSQAAFGDPTAGEIPYYGPARFDAPDEDLVTRASVARYGGSAIVRENATAKDEYGVLELGKSGLQVIDDTVPTGLADWLVSEFASDAETVPSITLKPGTDTAAWTQAITRRLGDRVTVKPVDGSAAVEVTVEGKRWSAKGRDVSCSLTLGRAITAVGLWDSGLWDSARWAF